MEENPFDGEDGMAAVDAVWVILCAFIIFTMQSGFGLLESGMVSPKSESNVIVKNMLDVCLGGIAYWVVGYGFSFGPNSNNSTKVMSGKGHFLTDVNMDIEPVVYAKFFFQLSFATTATTIISGAVAERIHLSSYMIVAIVNTGFIYVFPAHWMWDENGWLSENGAYDFAGSSVVHMAGGASAFAAMVILGPRTSRYGASKLKYQMASPTNVVLGTFFLWWGWIGFNCGSTFAMSGGGSWKVASKVAVVTMLGAMGGGAFSVILSLTLKFKRKYLLDIPDFVSGVLGGLVAVTAPCAVIRPWEGLVIGFIGGGVAVGFIKLLDVLHIDDPVGCFGVHWGAGLWGMIATGLFAEQRRHGHIGPFKDKNGIFRGGNGHLLGYNLAACAAITVWSVGLNAIVMLILKYTIGIRMSEEEEMRGSDEVEHNIVSAIGGIKASGAFGRKNLNSTEFSNSTEVAMQSFSKNGQIVKNEHATA